MVPLLEFNPVGIDRGDYGALPRCDEGVPRTGEKIRWIKTEVSFSGVYQPSASSGRLPITTRILRFGRMLAWGRGSEMMRGATAPQHDFAAGLRAGERSGGLPSSTRRMTFKLRALVILLDLSAVRSQHRSQPSGFPNSDQQSKLRWRRSTWHHGTRMAKRRIHPNDRAR